MHRWVALLAVGCGRIDFVPLATDASASGLTYREAVLEDTPVTYWRLDDIDAIARDEMGRLEGTYIGGCTHGVAGSLALDPGTAVHFDGAGCHVEFPGQIDFAGLAPFSVELWVALDELGGLQPIVMNEVRVGTQPEDGFAMLEGNTAGATYFERTSAGSNRITTRFVPTVGVFAHLVGTYDGASLVLYANTQPTGAPAPATGVMASTAAAMAVLGSYPSVAANQWLHGTLDEVAIYDRVLPLDRIELHYTIGTLGPQ